MGLVESKATARSNTAVLWLRIYFQFGGRAKNLDMIELIVHMRTLVLPSRLRNNASMRNLPRCPRNTLPRSWVACFLAYCVASAWSSLALGQSQSAAELYDQLAIDLAPLHAALIAGDPSEDPSESRYEREGVADARMTAWLSAARPFRADILRAVSLHYERPLDRSQGFALLLPHLSEQRNLARATRWLALDAIRSGDTSTFGELIRAQSTLALRSAEDHVLISSLVGLAIGLSQQSMIGDMIDRGELPQEAAAAALAATTDIRTHDFVHLSDALLQERDMAILEMETLSALEPADRAQRLGALEMADAAALSDGIQFDEFKGQATAFYDACRSIVNDPHAPGVEEAIAKLEGELMDGKYGELTKQFAPAIGRMIERALEYDAKFEALAVKLSALADGSKKPGDFMVAANFYAAAATACAALGLEEQAEIETLRLAKESVTSEQLARTARLLDRLQVPITENVVAGSSCASLAFGRTGPWAHFNAVNGLIRETMPGIQGAVRVTLAQALITSNATLALACIRACEHYASVGNLGHSLVAEQIAKDSVIALEALRTQGALTEASRLELALLVAKFPTDDPFRYRRAIESERHALAATPVWIGSEGGQHVRPFDEDRLRSLPPNQLVFLLAVQMRAEAMLTTTGCACSYDGALMDLRSWFDLDGLAKAIAQGETFRKQLELAPSSNSSPLAGLLATEPLDLSRRLTDQLAVLARLQELAKDPSGSTREASPSGVSE